MAASNSAEVQGGLAQTTVVPITTPPISISGTVKERALNTKRKVAFAVLVLVPMLALVSIFGYKWKHSGRPAFRTAKVVLADIIEQVTATGTLQPVITSPVGAQVSGIVWKLHADYNSKVAAGDLLVELDPALFQNAVASATAQLAQAEANLTSAQAAALGARIIRDRTKVVEGKSLVSKADLDATVAIFGQTTGVARSSVALIALARAQLDRAKLDLAHSIIRSPVEGTVIARNIDVGQAVAATLTAPTLFTIARDLHQMQVHAAVDEADIGEVYAGQSATFSVDAFRDETFAAVVHEVRNAPQTLSNVVTYDVVLDVDNPELKLRPGMTANVLILIVQRTQVAAVPNEALRFRPAAKPGIVNSIKVAATARPSAAVYVAQGAVPTRVPIKVGVTDGNMTEVDGLEPGREVIIDVIRDKGTAPSPAGAGRGN
jgi:HlyD family secretion protein